MNNIVIVDEFYSIENLIENIYTLFPCKYFVAQFVLEIVQVAHVTVFHYQKIPITL